MILGGNITKGEETAQGAGWWGRGDLGDLAACEELGNSSVSLNSELPGE